MRRSGSRPVLTSAALAIAALVIAGCSDSDSGDADASSPSADSSSSSEAPAETSTAPAPSPGGTGVTLTFGLPEFPDALTDGEGNAVYTLTADQQGPSTCEGQCAENWPPVLTTGEPTLADGSTNDLIGLQERSDGTMQATYDGWPLYTFIQDAAPGDANGAGISAFGGQFLLIQEDGTQVGG